MTYNQTSLLFHQTFKPESQYISSILSLAINHQTLTTKEISLATGIPSGSSSGKVDPHMQYASFMGLISYEKKDGKYEFKCTDLGNEIYLQDPGFQEKISILLCHGQICRNMNGAPVWAASFKEIFPQYHGNIDKDTLIRELSLILNVPISKKVLAPFFSSYEDFFNPLGLLSINNDNISISCLPFEKDFIYAYAHILFDLWENEYPSQEEITSNEFSKLCFGKTFGWSNKTEYEFLETLNEKGLIRLNRQLIPFTILKNNSAESLICKIYSELC